MDQVPGTAVDLRRHPRDDSVATTPRIESREPTVGTVSWAHCGVGPGPCGCKPVERRGVDVVGRAGFEPATT